MGHVVVPLMGRFKNETGERNLVLVLANETNGGLKVRKWIDRFTALLKLEDQGSSTGPSICDEAGMAPERNLINDELHAALSIVQATTQVIPADIIVSKKFKIHCSFRRG